MAVNTYQPGNAIILRDQIVDPATNPPSLVDPDTIFISILEADTGNLIVDGVPMTKVSIGRYQYVYQSAPSDRVSTNPWLQIITVSRGGRTNIKKSPSFYLSIDPVA